MKKLLKIICIVMASWISTNLQAEELAADIVYLQTRWAEIKYQLPEKEQEQAFAVLVSEAEKLRASQPQEAP